MLDNLSSRQLQQECARALSTFPATNAALSTYNKKAEHNSIRWYTVVLEEYIARWGGLPSQTGPGREIKLLLNNV